MNVIRHYTKRVYRETVFCRRVTQDFDRLMAGRQVSENRGSIVAADGDEIGSGADVGFGRESRVVEVERHGGTIPKRYYIR